MRRLLTPTIALVAAIGLSCGDKDSAPTEPVVTTGSIRVTAHTTGVDLDPDGYVASIDGGASETGLDVDGQAEFDRLSLGEHQVELRDVADNCTVQGDNPRTVSIGSADIVGTTFEIECVVSFVMIELGTLGGDSSAAWDINDQGQVVGWSGTGDGSRVDAHAFLWENGVMTDLGTLGGSRSRAWAINSRGQVVGSAYIDEYDYPFLYENGVMRNLGFYGRASDINSQGWIIGGWDAWLWVDGTIVQLEGLDGPSGINDRGQVVGTYAPNKWDSYAVLWEDGDTTHLGTLGGLNDVALDINDQGQIVGASDGRAVLWKDGVITDLGALRGSSASAINSLGQVVGRSSSHNHALFWENGVVSALPGDCSRSWAHGINANGQIVGECDGRALLWEIQSR